MSFQLPERSARAAVDVGSSAPSSASIQLSSSRDENSGEYNDEYHYDNTDNDDDNVVVVASVSVAKIMTQLLTIPSNRSCADCKSALVDTSQIYASFSPTNSYNTIDNSNSSSNSSSNNIGMRGRSIYEEHNHRTHGSHPHLRKSKNAATQKAATVQPPRIHTQPSFQQHHEALRPQPQQQQQLMEPTSSQRTNVQSQHTNANTDAHRKQKLNINMKIPSLHEEWMIDPAVSVPCYHGVFVCSLCGAAHQLLHRTTTTVRAVMDLSSSWTRPDLQRLQTAGGNAYATNVYEAYYHQYQSQINHQNHHPTSHYNSTSTSTTTTNNNNHFHSNTSTATTTATYTTRNQHHVIQRPTSTSTIADRVVFIRAKYEALAFVLPSMHVGPYAQSSWYNIVHLHPEWDGLWGANLQEASSMDDLEYTIQQEQQQQQQEQQEPLVSSHDQHVLSNHSHAAKVDATTNQNKRHPNKHNSTTSRTSRDPIMKKPSVITTPTLPNRLVDYFCVVTASECMHPSMMTRNLSRTALSPEDILLSPIVTDCIPTPDSYTNNNNNTMNNSSHHDMPHDSYHSDHHNDSMVCENSIFPEHLPTFVFPDGCVPSLVQLPPLFFTLVLTNSSGERLYGGILRLYDDNYDTCATILEILQNSDYPTDQYPVWIPQPISSHTKSTTTTKTTVPPVQPSRSTSLPNTAASSLVGTSSTTTSSSSVRIQKKVTNSSTTTSDVMFLPKCLVLLSHYPFFDLYRKFLLQIYRIALTEAPLPMERFVANFGTNVLVLFLVVVVAGLDCYILRKLTILSYVLTLLYFLLGSFFLSTHIYWSNSNLMGRWDAMIDSCAS
jgi:hypothetical protein